MKEATVYGLLALFALLAGCSKQSQIQPAATSSTPKVVQAAAPAVPETPAPPAQPAPSPEVGIAGKFVREVCTPIPMSAPPGPNRAYAVAARIESMQRVEFVGAQDSYEMRVLETYDGSTYRQLSKPIVWESDEGVVATTVWTLLDPDRALQKAKPSTSGTGDLDSVLAIERGSQLNLEKNNGAVNFLVGVQTRVDSQRSILSVFWPDPEGAIPLSRWYALHQLNTEWNTCFAIDSGATY